MPWLCCVLLLLPRVAKLMFNFDSTRRRDSMRGWRRNDFDSVFDSETSAETTSQRSGVLLCVCAHCRSPLQKLNSAQQLTTTHTTAHRHHTHTTELNSHALSLSLCHFASLWLLGTGRAVAAEQQQQSSKGNQPPDCIARSLAHTASDSD